MTLHYSLLISYASMAKLRQPVAVFHQQENNIHRISSYPTDYEVKNLYYQEIPAASQPIKNNCLSPSLKLNNGCRKNSYFQREPLIETEHITYPFPYYFREIASLSSLIFFGQGLLIEFDELIILFCKCLFFVMFRLPINVFYNLVNITFGNRKRSRCSSSIQGNLSCVVKTK